MACNLTIDNILGQGPPLVSVLVEGTSKGCSQVSVTIHCTGQYSATNSPVAVSSSGHWQTTFSIDQLKLAGCVACANPKYPITVTAKCVDPNQTCFTEKILTEIPCSQTSPCPTLGAITPKQVGGCFALGSLLDLDVAVYDPNACITQYVWIFTKQAGQCTGGSNAPCPGGSTVYPVIKTTAGASIAINLGTGFAEGNWTVQVYADPSSATACANCPQVASQPLAFSIMQPNTCPRIINVSPQLTGSANAGYTFVFTATFSGNTTEARASWDFGAGLSSPECLCGAAMAHKSYTYPASDCGQSKTVSLVLDPGNGCCSQGETLVTVDLPPCGQPPPNGGCPWWNPFCKGLSLCGALLAAALLAIFAVGVLTWVAGCATADPITAAVLAAVAEATAAVGLVLLVIWTLVCSKLPGFCHSLNALIQLFTYIVAVQFWALILLWLGGALSYGTPCFWGEAAQFAYYGAILAHLLLIKQYKHC
jgi:hypothetical protein